MTQDEIILQHLRKGWSITPMDALRLCGCFRLSGRIYDIKKQLAPDEEIETKSVTLNGKTFASYRLIKTADVNGQHSLAI